MNTFYITSALKPEQLPEYNLPEIGLIGRSNCGKSTLLNTLLQRKNLAKTSRTPGRTQMVNFFSVNDQTIFADLPGYGFSQTQRINRKHWQDLMAAYLERGNIAYILFLIDARRDPLDEDWKLLAWLAEKHPIHLIITKSDKLNRSEVHQRQTAYKAGCEDKGIRVAGIHAISSLRTEGIQELRDILIPQ